MSAARSSRRHALRTSAALLGAFASAPSCVRRRARSGPARRVVTLGPNVTEILFALGAGDTVVGVSRYDDLPPEALGRPRVGGLVDPSFEAIVALRPDAVCGARGPLNRAVLDRLEQLGVQTVFPPFESIADIRAALAIFARLVARTSRLADVDGDIARRVASVESAVRARARPGVLAVFGVRPISIAGPGSFVDELIRRAGGRNVAPGPSRWPTVSLEAVLGMAPDVVLDFTHHDSRDPLARAWSDHRTIPAVRDGRVLLLDDPMLLRPGPRIGRALEVIARALHGDRVV